MCQEILTPVPDAYVQRLLRWLGDAAKPWLDTVPDRIQAAAEMWQVVPISYHDAGATSVKVLGRTSEGSQVMLKSWFDPAQASSEVLALRAWAGGTAVRVVAYDDGLVVAVLELIGDQPGGEEPSGNSTVRVRDGLERLHRLGRHADHSGLTTLFEHATTALLPGLTRSLERVDLGVLRRPVAHALEAADALLIAPDGPTILHGNLYRDHVLFRPNGEPCFIDPTALIGDPAYDWASWLVLYDRENGHQERLDAIFKGQRLGAGEILHWATIIAADELAFRIETKSSGIWGAEFVLRWVAQQFHASD